MGPLVIEDKRRPALIEAVEHLWGEIGFDALPGTSWVLRAVVTARLYRPTSKLAVPGICGQPGAGNRLRAENRKGPAVSHRTFPTYYYPVLRPNASGGFRPGRS